MISTCQNCGTSRDLCEQDNKKKFNFCGNWSLSDVGKNNAVKLREAAEFAMQICPSLYDENYAMFDGYNIEVTELKNKLREALSVPPRNCDVGTAEEQALRFNEFCMQWQEPFGMCPEDCPFIRYPNASYCQSAWMQMPYKSENQKVPAPGRESPNPQCYECLNFGGPSPHTPYKHGSAFYCAFLKKDYETWHMDVPDECPCKGEGWKPRMPYKPEEGNK